MKKISIILIFFTIFSFSQNTISVEIINISYLASNNTIDNCGTIDLESEEYVPITFDILLTRGYNPNADNTYNNQYGSGTVYIELESSTNGMIGGYDQTAINTWNWFQNSATGEQTYTLYGKSVYLNSTEFGLSGNYFYVTYNCGADPLPQSCDFPIIKNETPTFTISPTTTSVSCNSTSSKTFTVDNVNNSPGSLEYHWNVGNGWKDTNGNVITTPFTTTTSSVNLIPYQYPPSDVQVTPYLDGVAYNTLISTVELSDFSTNNTIVGPSSVCSTGTYQLENSLPSGGSVTWSVDNPLMVTLVPNGDNVTVNVAPNQSGYLTLFADISNACNQTVQKQKTIYVGAPNVPMSSHRIYGGWDNVPITSSSQLNVDWIDGANYYLWTISPSLTATAFTPGFYTSTYGVYVHSLSTTSRYVQVNWGTVSGDYMINCWAVNGCSQKFVGSKHVFVYNSSNNPCPSSDINQYNDYGAKNIKVKVYPNPSNGDDINISKLDPISLTGGAGPCNNDWYGFANKKSETEITNTVFINDIFGKAVYKNDYNTNDIKIKGLHLKQGTYYIILSDSRGNSKKVTYVVK